MVKRNKLLVTALAATLAAASSMSGVARAESAATFGDARPGGISMMADALIARPFLMGATAIGAGLFTLSLPFTLVGGTTDHTWDTLVVTPAEAAFVRCLGCTPVQHERARAERITQRQVDAAAAEAPAATEESAN